MSKAASSGKADLQQLEQTRSADRMTELPEWSAFEPARVASGIRTLLAESEAAFEALEAGIEPTWAGLMEPLERIDLRLGRLLGTVLHLLSVKYSDALQAAYDGVRPAYVALSNRMGQSRPVYAGMLALRDGPEWGRLSPAQQRIVTESIRGMERSGVHLEGSDKARYLEIQERLSELSNQFQTNLVKEEKASRIRVTDPAEVEGVPEAVRVLAATQAREDGALEASAAAGPWHFVVNGVNYMAVIQNGRHRGLREHFYRAFRARGTSAGFDNRPVVEEILRLRQESAALVGFPNYAALSIDMKMAPSVRAVWELLNELEAAARPAAEREYEALKAFMAEQKAPEAAAPGPWDIAYWMERLREARYDYDAEALREYFQMPRVLDGLFALVHKLYDVEIRRHEGDDIPVWDDSVWFFDVLQQGEVIAGFFMDPYARSGEKRGGAWMNRVVGKNRLLAPPGLPASLPVALFVMNARPPAAGRPALLSLEEVRTLFHEFGHATQHMFTTVVDGGAAGMNLVEWDAVELASQFNEYWMEHKPFLRAMTAHVDTGEPLPDATLDRIIDSRNFMIGNATLRQLTFAKTDMALHEHYGLPGEPATPAPEELERDISQSTLVTPLLPDESQLPAFGHLFAGGYAAGYYSYKWAEVLAADAFAAFREVGLEDERAVQSVARRFRDTVLALGGSEPAAAIYRQFRGRDATAVALLRDQGLR